MQKVVGSNPISRFAGTPLPMRGSAFLRGAPRPLLPLTRWLTKPGPNINHVYRFPFAAGAFVAMLAELCGISAAT